MSALVAAEPGLVRVLIVDDTPTLRELTRLTLQGSGFEVVGEAGDGLTGLKLARQLQPDLVLLDLAMPVMDGLEALPLLRAQVPAARVVIVSGFDHRAMEAQVLEAGADAYLQKGVSPHVTLETLREMFPDTGPLPIPRQDRTEPVVTTAVTAREAGLEEEIEELLYVVSHDLSEPVHVIRGFAKRLARRAHSEEEGEFCEFILSSADRMQQLLDDLMAYAKAGRAELPQELLDCRRLVDNVLAGLDSVVVASGGRVITGALPRDVVANRLVLTQVLHNLVSNALKFVRPGVAPVVRVESTSRPGWITFSVADNGLGIDPDQFERIFLPFKRLHSRDRFPGSGIGLAICRRLVERQGGRIWLESGESGTTFFVEVPA